MKRADACVFQNTIDTALVALHGDPLKLILREAFGADADQISGPSRLDSDCFDVIATLPPGATKDQVPGMLERLLVERLGLTFHIETRMRSGYALVVDKSGPKLKPSGPDAPMGGMRAGEAQFGAGDAGVIKGSMSMTTLARFVSRRVNAPVEDRTGLEGKYDVDLRWTPASDLATGDIFTAVQQSLGLRLESRRQSVEQIVIDHIERVPAGN